MKIWTSCTGQRIDSADNTRTMLMCSALLRRGHEVVLWTSAYDHVRKQWRAEWQDSPQGFYREDGLQIRFLKGCGYPSNMSPLRFLDHYLVSRAFEREMRKEVPPDLIVASLPDHWTAAVAVRYGRQRGVPTIVDVRDKWPDVIFDRLRGSALAAAANLVLLREHQRARTALRDADALVANMKSMMDWGLHKGRRAASPRERVFYLTTSPRNFDLPVVAPDSQTSETIARVAGKTVFSFIGTFNQFQNPSLVLDAIDLLARTGRFDPLRVAVVIGGDGLGADEVRRRAASYENVHVIGWVNQRQMSALLASSHVGLLPLNHPSPAFNNKAFAYLASGLPILNGATGDLAELIDSEGLGINTPAGDPRAFAEAMHRLASDHAYRQQLSENVKRVFLARFDRDANYTAYAEHIERIAMESAA